VALQRWFEGSGPVRPSAAGSTGAEHEYRPARSSRLASGTLACPACDGPVAAGPSPLAPMDRLTCPLCSTTGVVRDFLSVASPSRPARVVVSVVAGPRRAVR
jgi:hypothetical protein